MARSFMSNHEHTGPLVAVSANSAWNLLNFRRHLIGTLLSNGYRLVAIIPPGDGAEALQDLSIDVELVPMSPRGLSPMADALLFFRYWRILRRLRPSAFLGFTAKPNIYGAIAAEWLGIKVINNITGLGTSFLSGRFLERLVSSLYKRALRRSATVYFHNADDLELFVGRKLVTRAKSHLIPGSGIDLTRFSPAPWPEGVLTFLFIGRLLIDKGIVEFGEAAATVKKALPRSRFVAVGEWPDHPRAAPSARLNALAEAGVLELTGSVDDVRPLIERAHCVVLPSYREGLPRALLEASAMARPSIAANVPGCRDVIEDGVTGFLCAPRSSEALAAAMMAMARLADNERRAMGQKARQRAEERFGEERVGTAYLAALNQIRR